MAYAKILNGAILRDVEQDAGEALTLIFDKGRLRIENPYTLRCDFGEPVTPLALIGCAVTAAYSTDSDLVLVLDGRISLSISRREEDFSGPQAAVFTSATGEVVAFK